MDHTCIEILIKMTIAFKFLLRMIFITFGNISGTELEKIQVCLMCFDLMLGRRENLNFKFPQRQASSPGVVANSILRSGRHQALALLLILSCAAVGIKPWRCCSFQLNYLRSGRHLALALLLIQNTTSASEYHQFKPHTPLICFPQR